MSSAPHKWLVESGYDRMAEQYLATKDAEDPATLTELEKLSETLSHGAAILDLGCGAGVPATRWLARRFAVTGVDISERQLALAQRNVPEATLIQADMTKLNFAPQTFNSVVSFYAITHVLSTEQPGLVSAIYRWLKSGGLFLATWSSDEWEGEEKDWNGWGAPMRCSNLNRDANLAMLDKADFEIKSVKRHENEDEQWLWILARKPPGRTEQ